jgi:hypothetical protein
MYTCREGRGEGALTEECAGSRSNKGYVCRMDWRSGCD